MKISPSTALKALPIILIVFFSSALSASAVSVFITQQGGTGTTSPSGILSGDNGATTHLNTVTIGSGLTFTGGTLSATGGTNYWTNTGGTTYLNTGSIAGFPTFNATSTTGTSTITNSLTIGSGSSFPLVIIGSTTPTYGYLAQDRLDVMDNRNDYSATNIANTNTGNCATADVTTANDLNSSSMNFFDFGHTSSGFTGVGCTNNPFPGFSANSSYLFDPTGNMSFALGSSSNAQFRWFIGGYATANQKMTLTNSGNLGINSTNPLTPLWVHVGTNMNFIARTTGPILQIGTLSDDAFSYQPLGIEGSTITLAANSGGNVGIGTSTPGSLLSVNNIANFTAATSTFYSTGGINLTGGGCFAISGVCISGGGTTYTATYPIQITGSVISLAFGTTTSNTWAGTQTFTNSPVFSVLTAGTVNSTAGGTIYNTATTSLSVGSPLTVTGTLGALIGGTNSTINCQVASGSQAGCLASADWTTFNSKQSALTGTTGQFPYFSGTNTVTATSTPFLNTTGGLGIGTTTTPFSYSLEISNANNQQLVLSSGSVTAPQWAFRTTPDGTLNIGTTSPSTYATSSPSGIQISSSASTFLGVGTTSPWRNFSLVGNVAMNGLSTAAGTVVGVCLNSSSFELMANTGTNCTVSSKRFKHDIQYNVDGLTTLMQFKPATFKYNGTDLTKIGFIAEDINNTQPELATEDKDGNVNSIEDIGIISVTVKAVQEQQAEIMAMKAGAIKDLQDKWQWLAIVLLVLALLYQQRQISQIKMEL